MKTKDQRKSQNVQDLRGPTAGYSSVSPRMRKLPPVQEVGPKSKLAKDAGINGIGKTKRKK